MRMAGVCTMTETQPETGTVDYIRGLSDNGKSSVVCKKHNHPGPKSSSVYSTIHSLPMRSVHHPHPHRHYWPNPPLLCTHVIISVIHTLAKDEYTR